MKDFSVLIESYIREKQESKGLEFCPTSWLDSAAKRASQISVATHVLKYTHSDAQGTNIHVKSNLKLEDQFKPYISTNSFPEMQNDFAGNAAVLDVAVLLQLEIDGVILLDFVAKGDSSPFIPFAKSEQQLSSWMSGFSAVFNDRAPASHTLAKQVYFPVGDGAYNLLSPLFSSSIAQVLYDRIKENRFGEKAKAARDCKRKEQYSDTLIVDYPHIAIQKFGGTKTQNISKLNSSREGKSYLLQSVPPIWVSIKKPPLKKNSFWKEYDRRVFPIINEFKSFLISIQKLNNKDIRNKRISYIDQLLDLLIQIAAEVQALKSGWSENSEISFQEQLWLDPLREDQDFKNKRTAEEWMKNISQRFATFLIQKLKYNSQLQFADEEHLEFSCECLKVLKEIER